MKAEKNRLMIILILVIVVLLGIIAYAFVLKPVLNGYTIKSQNEGVQYTIFTIMQQASKCQQVPLTFQNQTMNLIWVDCLQQQTQQTIPTQ
jgi:flagellar basal body-associated protein FliL